MMKIVFLVDCLHSVAAGSERQLFKLVSGLQEAGHSVQIVLLRHTLFTENISNFPCELSCLNIKKLASLSSLRKIYHFRRYIITSGTHIVHGLFPDSCVIAPAFLKSKSCRIVTSRRDIGLIYNDAPLWILSLLRKRVDLVIANSSMVKSYVIAKEKLLNDRVTVIYNGLENYSIVNSLPTPYSDNVKVKLILVANIKPVKRTIDAVLAVSEFKNKGIYVELALVGEIQDPQYADQLVKTIKKLDLGDRVFLLGSVEEPRRLLNYASIGLLCSESEGLSNAIMEYMQAGLPSVVSDVGGNAELIEDDITGYVYPKSDISALVDKIKKLSDDRHLAENISEQAKHKISKYFSIDRMVLKHIKTYEALINEACH